MKEFLVGVFALTAAADAHAMAPREIYQKSGAAVVLILGSDDAKSGSGGTGSIVTTDGQVITNAHVILNAEDQPYKQIYIYLKPAKVSGDNAADLKQRFTATVKGFSPPNQLDLALLQINNAPTGLATVQFGDPDDVRIGDPVVAIGHPEQGGLWTLTTGTISTVIQNFDRMKGKHVFQTETSFNRGNSGGPLFNDNGAMVGINTMIARKAADGLAITAVNFSLKSSVAVNWLKAHQNLALAYAPSTGTSSDGQTALAMADKPASNTKAVPPAAAVADAKVKMTPPPAADKPADKPAEVPKNVKIEIEKRPYNLDDLLRNQMKELDDMMGEMRGKATKKLKGKKGMDL